jgi:predicted nucleic acid-binding protein
MAHPPQKKRLYLDLCTLCRPFDDQSQMRIRLETNAYYLIIQALQAARYAMVVSPVHFLEANAINDLEEKREIIGVLETLGTAVECDLAATRRRAEDLYAHKFGLADAAHLAFAEAKADFSISCDDRLLRQCRRAKVAVNAMSPVEFIIVEDLK